MNHGHLVNMMCFHCDMIRSVFGHKKGSFGHLKGFCPFARGVLGFDTPSHGKIGHVMHKRGKESISNAKQQM